MALLRVDHDLIFGRIVEAVGIPELPLCILAERGALLRESNPHAGARRHRRIGLDVGIGDPDRPCLADEGADLALLCRKKVTIALDVLRRPGVELAEGGVAPLFLRGIL